MKTLLAALTLVLSNAAFAADSAPAVTQWDQSQDRLVRQFSQGFGFAVDEAHPLLVAKADAASAGPTADASARHRDVRPRAPLHHVKLPKHSH
jgi:hypothetical protein